MLGEKLIELIGAAPIILAFLALLWKGDDALSEEARDDLSLYLLLIKMKKPKTNWPTAVERGLNWFFGRRHFSWECFFASALVSCTGIFVVFFYQLISLYIELQSGIAIKLGEKEIGVFPTGEFDTRPLAAITLVLIVFNIAFDYVSLFKTRVIIRFMNLASGTKSKRKPSIILLFVLDWLSSVLVFLIGLLIFLAPAMIFYPELKFTFDIIGNNVIKINTDLIVYLSIEAAFLASFITTCFTSMWMTAVFLGIGLIRLLTKVGVTVKFLQYALPIINRPMRSIGIVLALVSSLVLILLKSVNVF